MTTTERTIADMILPFAPDGFREMTAAELLFELDSDMSGQPLASIRGIYSELSIYLLEHSGFAVAPFLRPDSPQAATSGVHFFRPRAGEPSSQAYMRALVWASQRMAEELETEERG